MKNVYEALEEMEIAYTEHEHPAVFTVEEAREHYEEMPGGHCKNLFLRNKNGNTHYLVVVESSKRVNLKKIEEYFSEKKLSFASPERLKKYLCLTPGAVSPMGLIHDSASEVQVLVDEDLLEFDTIYCHPDRNTASLGIPREDFQKFFHMIPQKISFQKIES